MENPSDIIKVFDDTKEPLERNLGNINNVAKPSKITLACNHMKEVVLERNPVNVKNVVKHAEITVS